VAFRPSSAERKTLGTFNEGGRKVGEAKQPKKEASSLRTEVEKEILTLVYAFIEI
jgi:hypothetical protein